MSKKISELSDASALDGTEQVELVQSGANVKTTVNDLLPVQLQGDKTIDLNAHTLELEGGNAYVDISGGFLFYIQSGDNNYFGYFSQGTTYILNTDTTTTTNYGKVSANSDEDKGEFALEGSFDSGAKVAAIRGRGESGVSSILYSADTHTFNGINDFANDGAAEAGGVPVGGLYHTSGTVKIRLV